MSRATKNMIEEKNNKEQLVEVCRSFSYKMNIPGAYESRDFFCSQKTEVPLEEAEKVSEALYQFCKKQVINSVNKFKQELKDPLSKIKKMVAEGKVPTVEDWENMSPEEQTFLQEVKKESNRITYKARNN